MDERDNARLGQLLVELARGNCAVLTEIAQLVERVLRAIGNEYFRNKADVEDTIQSLYVLLYHKASRFRQNTNASAWVIKLYINLIKSYLRRYKRDAKCTVELEAVDHLFAETDERHIENHLFMKEMLSKLSAYEYELVQLHFWGGCSIREVAKILHKSKGSVENDLKKLKEKMERV